MDSLVEKDLLVFSSCSHSLPYPPHAIPTRLWTLHEATILSNNIVQAVLCRAVEFYRHDQHVAAIQ